MSFPREGTTDAHAGAPSSKDGGAPTCGACGARARRVSARFCSTCGRSLADEYFPVDSLRASYRFEQRGRAQFARADTSHARGRRTRRTNARATRRGDFMFERNRDGASSSALAFAAYALVPYLGILFCPGAVLLGGVGLLRAWRSPQGSSRRRRDSALGLALGLLIFCAQLVLWWILYKVPEWSSRGNM
jgi:hypothetical protein